MMRLFEWIIIAAMGTGLVGTSSIDFASDDDAQAIFLNLGWTRTDEHGYPRLRASAMSGISSAELVPEWVFPERRIELHPQPLFSNALTTVYAIVGHPHWVLKYHMYCRSSESPVNDNLRESFFLNLVSKRFPEITNQYKYISAPAIGSKVCPDGFTLSTTRFIISSKVSETLWSLVSRHGRLNFVVAVRFAIQVFEMLQKLHSLHIVHGDIHAGNVAIKPGTGGRELLLIDFGRAAVVPTNNMKTIILPNEPKVKCDGQLSPWESLGATQPSYLSFRDDAFRALILTGFMIYGGNLMKAQMHFCTPNGDLETNREFIAFKQHINFFDTKNDDDIYGFQLRRVLPSELLPFEDKIRNLLMDVLMHVRGLAYGVMPDYSSMIKNLHAAVDPMQLGASLFEAPVNYKRKFEDISAAGDIHSILNL